MAGYPGGHLREDDLLQAAPLAVGYETLAKEAKDSFNGGVSAASSSNTFTDDTTLVTLTKKYGENTPGNLNDGLVLKLKEARLA